MKKTLVISAYAPPSGSGSGLMMYFLLKYLPQSDLAILTSEENLDSKLQEYRLEVPYYYYENKILAVKFNDRQESILQKIKRAIKNFWLTKFFAQIVLWLTIPLRIVSLGRRAVKEKGIEILLGYSDWGLVLFSVYLLHKITNKPFALHFYDMYVGNKMPWFFKLVSLWLEPRLFQEASQISVMCEELKEHYEKKYNRKILVIHNSIDFALKPPNLPNLPGPEFKIIFLGNIYWAQEDAVKNVVEAINQLSDIPVKLVLYTPHSKEYMHSIGIWENKKIIFNFCAPQEVAGVMANSDLLLVALSFKTKFPQLINTSSPGKLCEYLISGRPILIHAPPDSYMSKYAKACNFAYVADFGEINELKTVIRKAYVGRGKDENLVSNAFHLAVKNHLAQETYKKLESMVNNIT